LGRKKKEGKKGGKRKRKKID